MFPPDLREFVELLEKNKVEYLIVGGYAVSIHGYPRFTGDLDVWLNATENNANKILQTLIEFGFGSNNITVDDLLKPDIVIQLGNPPLRIDLLTSIDGVLFAEAYKNRKRISIEGFDVDFIGYHELLKNKKASGRTRDLNDLENLSPL